MQRGDWLWYDRNVMSHICLHSDVVSGSYSRLGVLWRFRVCLATHVLKIYQPVKK